MLPDAAKRPALPQSYLHMPSKPDMPIAHVLAICTVHVQELQRAAVLCLGFPGQRNRSCSYMRLHHVGGVWPHIWPAWWRLSPAPEHSWLQLWLCLFVVGCSPFSSSHSVSAGIDLHLTYLSEPRHTGEVIALCNCNHVEGLWANPLACSIIPSLKWFALPWAGRPELPVHHTRLSGEMSQRKRGHWVSMPFTSCRALKAVIAHITLKLIPFLAHFISLCSALTSRRKLVSLCHHIQERWAPLTKATPQKVVLMLLKQAFFILGASSEKLLSTLKYFDGNQYW